MLQTLREHLNPSAADGVSTHLNLLYLSTTDLSMDDDDALVGVLRNSGRFHIDFTNAGQFGTDSAYLVPNETAVLTNLATRIREVFPGYSVFDAVPERATPHVTIGRCAPLSELRAAEAEVLSKLPIRQVCTTVKLRNDPPLGTGHWQRHRTYQLET